MMKPDAIQRFEPFRPIEPEPVRAPEVAREREVKHAPPIRAANRTGRRLLGLGALVILSGAVGLALGVTIKPVPTLCTGDGGTNA